jgi:membrane protein YdbS with pleckstrin-like domain
MRSDSTPPRERVDLRTLPRWVQYAIALAVVLLVFVAVLLSWQSGNGPDPTWQDVINRAIVPVAGWVGIAALAVVLIWRLRRRR